MNARSTRGPGGGRHGGRRPPVRRTSGRGTSKPGCAMVAVAAGLVLGMSLLLVPLVAEDVEAILRGVPEAVAS